ARVLSARYSILAPGGRRPLRSFPTRRSSDLCPNMSAEPARRVAKSLTAEPGWESAALRGSVNQKVRVASRNWSFHSANGIGNWRSEEHTSELQSRFDLVCRLLLAKKKCKLQT